MRTRRTALTIIIMAAVVLGPSGSIPQAYAEGAEVTNQSIDLHYCFGFVGGHQCEDITGMVHRKVTPSGNALYNLQEEICFTEQYATGRPGHVTGTVAQQGCRRYREDDLAKDGLLQILAEHSQGTVSTTNTPAGATSTCTFRISFHEVDGRIQFDRDDSSCVTA